MFHSFLVFIFAFEICFLNSAKYFLMIYFLSASSMKRIWNVGTESSKKLKVSKIPVSSSFYFLFNYFFIIYFLLQLQLKLQPVFLQIFWWIEIRCRILERWWYNAMLDCASDHCFCTIKRLQTAVLVFSLLAAQRTQRVHGYRGRWTPNIYVFSTVLLCLIFYIIIPWNFCFIRISGKCRRSRLSPWCRHWKGTAD